LFCVADYAEGDVVNKEPDKCVELAWFAWDALPAPLFMPITNLINSGFNLHDVQSSRYQHYKGNAYEIVARGKHSETAESMVVYRALKDGSVWIRPQKMFDENVIVDGQDVPRFRRI